MTSRISAGTAARLGAGAVIAACALALTAGGIIIDWPGHAVVPVSTPVTPAAADTVLTCPGPVLALGSDASAADEVSAAASARLTRTGDDVKVDTLKVADSAHAGPPRLVAAADGQKSADAAGASSATADGDDVRGFVASSCLPAQMQSWLVGGSTTTGAADMVLLANPGDVAATVDLTVFSVEGASVPAGGAGIVVAPGTQKIVPLAGLGLGVEAPVVEVTSSGAPVRAALQTSITHTLVPAGVDQSGPVAPPSTHQVMTGVRVTSAPQNDPTTIVRLLAPHDDVKASVTVIGEKGTVGKAHTVPLTAGSPAELELSALKPGTYSVAVEADEPVVAATWQATGTGEGDDFAWIASAPELAAGDESLVAVPHGDGPRLVVTAEHDDAVVTATPVSGDKAVSVTVKKGRTASVALDGDTSYRLKTDAPARAAVTFAGDGALASFPAQPAGDGTSRVVVYR